MRVWKRIAAGVLSAMMLFGLLPVTRAAAADTASASGAGVRIEQKAAWDTSVPGGTTAKVTVKVSSDMDLQKPKDVVFVVDCSALQDLSAWKANAIELADYLRTVPGMRAALVSYASTPEKVLDFTTDFAALKSGINGLTKGVNSDAYAALRLAENLISSRSRAKNPACIAYFGNGRFNMNYNKALVYALQLLERVPVYCAVDNISSLNRWELSSISDGQILTPYEAALEIAESRVCPVAITEQLDDGFALLSASVEGGSTAEDATAGTVLGTVNLTMGRSVTMTVSATLRDPSRMGDLAVASGASVSVKDQTVTAGAVSLHRSGYRVTYDPNGGEGTVPNDPTLYTANSTVVLKPAVLRREGWNFSGWTHPTTDIRNGSFIINGDTEVDAAWGRGYVKLSSSNTAGLSGTHMLSRAGIEGTADKGFYNTVYWDHLRSITILSTEKRPAVPEEAVASWDVTDKTLSPSRSVMAWVAPGGSDGWGRALYSLTIAGQGGVTAPADCTMLFGHESSNSTLTAINGLEHLDVSQTTVMKQMFRNAETLQTTDTAPLNIKNWDISNVTDISGMFASCRYVTKLDVSGWNTGHVQNMASTFEYCWNLRELDVSGWNTSNVTTMSSLFKNCSRFTTIDVSGWNMSNAKYVASMFESCHGLTTLNVQGWDTSKFENMYGMFQFCENLKTLNVSGWKTGSVTTMRSTFSGCKALETLDVSKWDVSNVKDMEGMFSNCEKLKSVAVTNWNTAQLARSRMMFYNCKSLTSLDLRKWNASNFGVSFIYTPMEREEAINLMFAGCTSLKSVNLAGWNTANVQSLYGLFQNCNALTTVSLSSWNFSKVAKIDRIFEGCTNLTSFGITNWNIPTAGCTYVNWRYQANATLDSVVLKVANELSKDDSTTTDMTKTKAAAASLPGVFEEDPELSQDPGLVTGPGETLDPAVDPETDPVPSTDPEEDPLPPTDLEEDPAPSTDPKEEPTPVEAPERDPVPSTDPEEDPAPAVDPETDPASAVDPETKTDPAAEQAELPDDASSPLLDDDGRPVYARDKIGLWDLGRVDVSQVIDYTLQLQYLGEEVDQYGGVSGLMTVTNPIPVGLTFLEDTLQISANPEWIDTTRGGTPEGTIVWQPKVENGVLTFSVTGLSMGAQFTVYYSCITPDTAPTVYTEFLNTASVDDNGLPDQADPVRHYMLPENGTLPAYYQVTYAYDGTAPAGAPVYGEARYADGTPITLPQPVCPGFRFNGWRIGGAGDAVTSHTVTGDVHFVGSWTQEEIPNVLIDYTFTTPAPENAAAIQNALLADAVTEAPENAVTRAPALAAPPAGWTLVWEYPAGLAVSNDGSFNVGRQADWPGGTIRITGRWVPEEYTVTYAYASAPANAPALPAGGTYPCGASVPLAPDAAGTATHIFLGWSCSYITVGEDRTFSMPWSNVVITGTWMKKPAAPADPEVKVDPSGGFWRDSTAEQVLLKSEYDTMIGSGTFPAPVRTDGYTFQSWQAEADPDGLFDLIVTALWEAPAAPVQTCTLRFDAQGGTGVESQSVVPGGLAVEPGDPVRGGYDFQGWSRTPGGPDRWDFAADTVPGDMTLYAVWKEKTYQITGTVTDGSGNLIPGAHVKIVHEGSQVFLETDTGVDGTYTIENVPNGVYNTVASYTENGSTVTTTVLSVINGADLNQIIVFSTGNTNSYLTVDSMPKDTPYVVVGGLKAESESVRGENPAAESVKVEMNVTPTDRTRRAEDVEKLRAAAGEAVRDLIDPAHQTFLDLILDFELSRTVQSAGGAETSEKITETKNSNILRIVIPYPMEGKANILVHRCHEGTAVTFRKLLDLPEERDPLTDGTFYLDTENELIYVFASRFSPYAVSYTAPPETPKPVDPPVTPSSGGGGGGSGTSYIITATAGPGGTIQPAGKIRVPSGGSRTFTIRPETGCTIREVLVDGESVGAVGTYTFSSIRADHTLEAFFDTDTGGLFREDHIDYLHGFRDGLFRPDAPMTRGQAAQMFYNLLRNRETGGESNFSDVPETMWCYEAVSALKTLGVMVGVTADRFEPDRPITRGELVVTAVRFTEHAPGGASPFTDVADTDWYASQISAAAARGWIGGYADGTFRPNAPITRAQAASVINRLLNRSADEAFVNSRPAGLRSFPDVPEDYWAYYSIMEAANAHDYRVHGGGELWTRLR